jgi:hypothetical protein
MSASWGATDLLAGRVGDTRRRTSSAKAAAERHDGANLLGTGVTWQRHFSAEMTSDPVALGAIGWDRLEDHLWTVVSNVTPVQC